MAEANAPKPDANKPVEELNATHLADIPAHARERLQAMRGSEAQRGLFTSDLSVNEFLLMRRPGSSPPDW